MIVDVAYFLSSMLNYAKNGLNTNLFLHGIYKDCLILLSINEFIIKCQLVLLSKLCCRHIFWALQNFEMNFTEIENAISNALDTSLSMMAIS